MKKTFTCIICPNGCEIETAFKSKTILSITGAACPKGKDYVRNELTHPLRTVTSSILIRHGNLPLISIKLDKPIPKDQIFIVMEKIKEIQIDAPTTIGQIIISNILGLGSNVIATKAIERV